MRPTIQRRLALQCRMGIIGPAWSPAAPSALPMLRQAASLGWVELRVEPGAQGPARDAMQARLTRTGLVCREQWELEAAPRAPAAELPLPTDDTEGARS